MHLTACFTCFGVPDFTRVFKTGTKLLQSSKTANENKWTFANDRANSKYATIFIGVKMYGNLNETYE